MKLIEMTWPEVDALSRDTPIVFPVAALEQHGRHLTVFTDSLLLEEVIRRTEDLLKAEILIAPLMWLGNSEHHLDFPGTMSASPRVYLDLIRDMVECFLFHGFKRILVINGHGGNIVPLQQAMFEIRQRRRAESDLLLLSATYWTLGAKPSEGESSFKQTQMGHACEWETSMILRIRPDLARKYQEAEEVKFGVGFESAHRAWTTKDRTVPGHIGIPKAASAEKGEKLFEIFKQDLVALLKRMVDWNGETWE
jgi:creatinine amidohydrolase